mgnify:CR=1 FL=1
MKKRGFEIVAKYADAGLNLPQRQTKQAAGYDFEAAADFVVPQSGNRAFLKRCMPSNMLPSREKKS